MATTAVAERLLTADEFILLPEDRDGRKRELWDGKVITMSQPGEEHALVALNIRDALMPFVRANRLGIVVQDAGFFIRPDPDRLVCPDVAVVDLTKLPPDRDRTKAMPIAPPLAVEVVSPTNTRRHIAAKVAEYRAAGSERVWVAWPAQRTVTVHRPDGSERVLAVGATLTSDDAGFPVEGFSLPVADVFDLD